MTYSHLGITHIRLSKIVKERFLFQEKTYLLGTLPERRESLRALYPAQKWKFINRLRWEIRRYRHVWAGRTVCFRCHTCVGSVGASKLPKSKSAEPQECIRSLLMKVVERDYSAAKNFENSFISTLCSDG